ncbi:MAG: hypothetical protein ACP5IE_05140 [Infirmifilum sp.]
MELGRILGDPPPDLQRAYAKPNTGVYIYPGELLKAPSSLNNHSVSLTVISYKKVNKLISEMHFSTSYDQFLSSLLEVI